MKIVVDPEICQSHGQCAFVAPSVFRLDSDLVLAYEERPDESLRAAVEEAIAGCPTQAISELPEDSAPPTAQTPASS
jgi:ferredoxin